MQNAAMSVTSWFSDSEQRAGVGGSYCSSQSSANNFYLFDFKTWILVKNVTFYSKQNVFSPFWALSSETIQLKRRTMMNISQKQLK